MEKGQKLIKDTLTYMVANFGAKVLLLIVYPIYTYYVVPSDLGIYDLIISTLTLIYPIVVFSINDAVFRWLLDAEGMKQSEIIAIGLKISLRNILIVDVIYISVNLVIGAKYGWFILSIINFGALYPVLQQIARGLRKNKIFALSGLLYAIALVAFNVTLVIWLKLGVNGLLLSQVFAYAATCIFLFVALKQLHIKLWRVKISDRTKSDMIKYSLMLIPNSCCWWIMNASDRYLIKIFIGNAANGIYSISHKFPSVMNMMTSVFSLAWQEQAITEYTDDDRDSYYSEIYRLYYLLLFCTAMVLIPVTKWFVIFFVQYEYVSAWKYSAALYLGSVFLALASFLGTGYLSAKNTKGSMYTSMAGAIINIVVDLFLLPIIGLEAAAISTLFGNAGIWIARWIQAKQYFKIDVCWREFCFLIVLNILVGVTVRYTNLAIDIVILILAITFSITLNRKLICRLINSVKNVVHGIV